MSEPAKYLLAAWRMACELAEQGIAPSQPDDVAARDTRQKLVFDLAGMFFERMTANIQEVK